MSRKNEWALRNVMEDGRIKKIHYVHIEWQQSELIDANGAEENRCALTRSDAFRYSAVRDVDVYRELQK